MSALPTRAHRRAAVSYYRFMIQFWRKPGPLYADLHRYRFGIPSVPTLFLQGREDNAADAEIINISLPALGPGSRCVQIPNAGHFLQVEQPKAVCAEIVDFLSSHTAAR